MDTLLGYSLTWTRDTLATRVGLCQVFTISVSECLLDRLAATCLTHPPLLQTTLFTHTHTHGLVSRWNLTDKYLYLQVLKQGLCILKKHIGQIFLSLSPLALNTVRYLCLLTLSLSLACIAGLMLCMLIPNDINLYSTPCHSNFQTY